jgi:hypothetical protein
MWSLHELRRALPILCMLHTWLNQLLLTERHQSGTNVCTVKFAYGTISSSTKTFPYDNTHCSFNTAFTWSDFPTQNTRKVHYTINFSPLYCLAHQNLTQFPQLLICSLCFKHTVLILYFKLSPCSERCTFPSG